MIGASGNFKHFQGDEGRTGQVAQHVTLKDSELDMCGWCETKRRDNLAYSIIMYFVPCCLPLIFLSEDQSVYDAFRFGT